MATVEAPESGEVIARQLRDLVSADTIVSDAAQLAKCAIDSIVPSCAVSPSSTAEVAEIVKLCSANGWILVPAGGFSMQAAGRRLASCDVLLRTDRLNQVVFYDPGDLTIGLQAGFTVAGQRALLGQHKQWIPLPRRSAARSTVGGVAAAAIGGPTAAFYGNVREFCIGVQFVTGDGKIARGGGRVVKNVAGYDLMKLLIGSWGTLGVITELNFKVFPAPVQTRTYLIERETRAEIVAERERILATRLLPQCFEVVSPCAREVLQESGPGAQSMPWLLAVRGSGSDAVLARYGRDIGADAQQLIGEDEDAFWAGIEDYPDAVAARDSNVALLHIACTSEQVDSVLKITEEAPPRNSLLPAIVGRVALGSFLMGLMPRPEAQAAGQIIRAVNQLRAELPAGVMVNVLNMPLEEKSNCDPWDVRGANADLMGQVKRALDPAGILNRGRYIA